MSSGVRSTVTGAPRLARAELAHDGRFFAPWVAITTALSASSVIAYPLIFSTAADRAALAAGIGGNPALSLVFGPASDLTTSEGFNAWRSLSLGGFLAALGVILFLTRTTRAQEDSGQAELLASGVLGRAGRLLAAVGLCLLLSLVLGLVVTIATGLSGGAWGSSLLLAATMTATAWMFTGVAAVTAQLGSDARTANSLAVGTLGTLFLLRGFAYAVEAPAWTVWVNPLGWMTETRPASGDHWWPLLLAVGLTLVLLALAFILQARRDFGSGVLAPRPGPARGRGGPVLRLALRVNRGPLITWMVAFLVVGTLLGTLARSVQDIFESNTAVQLVLAAGAATSEDLTAAFLVTILSLVGIIAAVPGVQVMLKLRSEELQDRVEPVLGTAVTRPRHFAAQVLVALLAPALYLMLAGTMIAVVTASADIGVEFGDTVLQAAATVPATWTVVALSAAVVGARPQAPLVAWAGVLVSFGITLLGPTFRLWDWAMAISPFWHVPPVTRADADVLGLVWISAVTVVFLAIGLAGFRHRDVPH